jgi:ribonuclease D
MQIISSSTNLNFHISKIYESAEKYVILDTEFVREKTYYPSLGLIQVAYEGGEFILDPVEYRYEYSEFIKMLQDKNIVKVIHACGQDVEIFYTYFNCIPENVFDTQIAAKLLGFGEAASLNRLTESYLDITLDKTQRYTDWLKRPLEREQVEYALSDVTYLRDVYKEIRAELYEKGRFNWAVEESNKYAYAKNFITEPDDAWKKLKTKSQDPKYLSLVKCLARWREFTAQNQNRPRMWVLKDDAIQEIATLKPSKIDDLKGLRFYRYDDRTANELLGVVDFALNEEIPPKPEAKTSIPDSLDPIISMLKILLKAQSYKHNIAASSIADLDDLKEIALYNFDKSQAMQGWRYEIFGKFAEKLVNSQLALIIERGEVIMIEPDLGN